MICTDSLHQACQRLFADYPQAVSLVSSQRTAASSMVIMLRTDNDAQFFVLSRDLEAGSSFMLCRWPGEEAVRIQADINAVIPGPARNALRRGVPFPADGSLFGWTHEQSITALIVFYSEYSPTSRQPAWAVMPLQGAPEEQWPPFTDEHFFGSWFWQHHQAGRIVPLADLIATAPDTVFWADTQEILGSDCCVVAHDLRTLEGQTLQRGRYVYYLELRAGNSAPPLPVLLAETSKVDLAPRFQRVSHSGSGI